MPGGGDAKVVPALHPFDDFELDLDSIRTPNPITQTFASAAAGVR
jgi:hypothetical protein